MKKIVHYTLEIETEDSIHPEVMAEEILDLFDPFGHEDGKLNGCLIGVKSEDWVNGGKSFWHNEDSKD